MTYNANGSITSDRGLTFSYDGRERMIAAGSMTYYVSGLDQRIEKAGLVPARRAAFVNSSMTSKAASLAMYDAGSGTPIAEHIYFGDWPVGLLQGATSYYVHPDQLGAPHVVTRATDNQTVWVWQREPFGAGGIQACGWFRIQPAISRSILRCRDGTALQLFQRLRSKHREIHRE
jgi:hypothetical protein